MSKDYNMNQMQPCAGRNCGSTNPNLHSAECFEDYEKVTGTVQQEPVAWCDHVEQRLLTWRQSFVNRSGDQLALDDFMDKESLDDLIDFVCDEYTAQPRKEWQGLTDEEETELIKKWAGELVFEVTQALKEKNT